MPDLDANQRAAAEQFGRQSANYGKTHILADISDVARLLDGVDLPKGSCALDVATGGGHTALYHARRGWDVTIGDVAQPMLDAAEALLAEEGYSCDKRLFPAEAIPFDAASFSLVSSRVAPHHFSSVEGFVKESARVLKPGGWFAIIDGSVPDGSPELHAWINEIEKWRDPSHGRMLAQDEWVAFVEQAGLELQFAHLEPFKQPDLEWYFKTANTSPTNRTKVNELLETAPESYLKAIDYRVEDGKIVWWWRRLSLLARKPE